MALRPCHFSTSPERPGPGLRPHHRYLDWRVNAVMLGRQMAPVVRSIFASLMLSTQAQNAGATTMTCADFQGVMDSGGFLDRQPYLDMIARDAGPAALEDASNEGDAGVLFMNEMIAITTATEMICDGRPQQQFYSALQSSFDALEIAKLTNPLKQK